MYLINHASAETLLSGWFPWELIVHQQGYRPSDSNKHVDFKFSVKYVYILVVLISGTSLAKTYLIENYIKDIFL